MQKNITWHMLSLSSLLIFAGCSASYQKEIEEMHADNKAVPESVTMDKTNASSAFKSDNSIAGEPHYAGNITEQQTTITEPASETEETIIDNSPISEQEQAQLVLVRPANPDISETEASQSTVTAEKSDDAQEQATEEKQSAADTDASEAEVSQDTTTAEKADDTQKQAQLVLVRPANPDISETEASQSTVTAEKSDDAQEQAQLVLVRPANPKDSTSDVSETEVSQTATAAEKGDDAQEETTEENAKSVDEKANISASSNDKPRLLVSRPAQKPSKSKTVIIAEEKLKNFFSAADEQKK